MPILDDWNINFTEKVISHKDGVLAYTAASGTTPILNDYVLGTTSGAVGKIIGGSDLGGVIASGTLVLTNVIGRFQTAEPMEHLSEVPFNAVSNNGFTLGDSLTGPGSENIDVRAVEYNIGDTAGEGIIFGDNFTGAFDPSEQIDIVGGQADVANVLASVFIKIERTYAGNKIT